MLLLLAAIVFAGLLAGFFVLMSPNRSVALHGLAEPSVVAAACWAIAFIAPFVAEAGPPPVDAAMALTALSAFGVAVALESRKVNPMWAAFFGGVLFAGAIWAVSLGIYSEHALGWQGLRLDDIDSHSDLWMGAFFFAPTAALPGGLIGLIGSMTWRRARTVAA